ncbi:hypothetical protein [Streptomyces sp. AC512_CC834]|uniref:hypothetical protein n=1 Tax=Streptomyces sp. AC512_CC834 TaxID=2823691 RepID=UPI001C25BDE1|nr:hypothetical protein [Streptomyces sp. AC512_CC834]
MTGRKGGRAWVGDLIHDEEADRRRIVADVRGGAMWVLRPEYGPGQWTSERPDRLRVIKTRKERLRDRDT